MRSAFNLRWFAAFFSSAVCLTFSGQLNAAPADSPWNRDYFTNTELVAHSGEKVRFYDDLVQDKIVIINFMYTRCVDICPLNTARLAEVVEALGDRIGRDVFVYSITLEPEFDTPVVLASYADAYDAPPGWRFLTGEPDEVHRLRWKLGERARTIYEHRHDLLLGNDTTGEWERTSVFADLDLLAERVLDMHPEWRERERDITGSAGMVDRLYESSHPGDALFAKACASCHSIGDGDRVGPDLALVTKRRDRDWLNEFLLQPDVVLALGDPIALELDERFPTARMPNLGLSQHDIDDLISYIEMREAAK